MDAAGGDEFLQLFVSRLGPRIKRWRGWVPVAVFHECAPKVQTLDSFLVSRGFCNHCILSCMAHFARIRVRIVFINRRRCYYYYHTSRAAYFPHIPPGPLKPKSRFVRMSGFVVNEATTSDQIQLSATAASSRGRIWPEAGFKEVIGSKDTRLLPIRVPQLVRTLEMAIDAKVLSPINVHSSILVCIRVS